MAYIVDSLKEDTFKPLSNAIKRFVSSPDAQSLSPLQLRASRRMTFLCGLIGSALDSSASEPFVKNQIHHQVATQVRRTLDLFKMQPYVVEALSEEAVREEAVEEVCYVLKDVVLRPLDSTIWCSISREFFEKLALLVAKKLWEVDEKDEEKQALAQASLAKAILEETAYFSALVRHAAANDMSKLEFEPGANKGDFIDKPVSMINVFSSSKIFLDHTTTPKW